MDICVGVFKILLYIFEVSFIDRFLVSVSCVYIFGYVFFLIYFLFLLFVLIVLYYDYIYIINFLVNILVYMR